MLTVLSYNTFKAQKQCIEVRMAGTGRWREGICGSRKGEPWGSITELWWQIQQQWGGHSLSR